MSNTNIDIQEVRMRIEEFKEERKEKSKITGFYKENLHEAEKLIKELGYIGTSMYLRGLKMLKAYKRIHS